ncbi:hypothetical protein niasHS_000363 [Heterodera schachtii]|uniref:Uncharacterized protein n=1 Tax=Heterodera schachtii TaxID=97005 RepID=A0ABD2K651_HETSC
MFSDHLKVPFAKPLIESLPFPPPRAKGQIDGNSQFEHCVLYAQQTREMEVQSAHRLIITIHSGTEREQLMDGRQSADRKNDTKAASVRLPRHSPPLRSNGAFL